MCIFLAELAGRKTLREKEKWLFNKWDGLKDILPMNKCHDSPSDSTLGRVLRNINAQLLQKYVSNTIRVLLPLSIQIGKVVHFALDGKSRSGVTSELTGRTEIDLTIFHPKSASIINKLTIPDKLGESTAAPGLIEETFKSSFQNGVLTFDCAMTTPTVTRAVIDSGNEYLGGLKGFNGKVYEIAESYDWGSVEVAVLDKEIKIPHGREEEREVKIIEISKLPDEKKEAFFKYADCGIIVRVFRKRLIVSTQEYSEEVAFYVGSLGLLDLTAKEIYKIQREHWLIENRSNWVRDVVLQEDDCKTKSTNASRCLGAVRDLVLQVAFNDGGKKGIKDYIDNFADQVIKLLSVVKSLECYKMLENLGVT